MKKLWIWGGLGVLAVVLFLWWKKKKAEDNSAMRRANLGDQFLKSTGLS